MKDGVVQQVGEPQSVYDRPLNTFVATFIGNPVMSMFRGEVHELEGQASFVSPALCVPLPGRLRAALADHDAAGPVTLGVRSEHVLVSTCPRPDTIDGRVVLVEPVGSDMFVNLAIGGERCVARTEPRTDLEEGQTVWLTFDAERLHLFDTSGNNVVAAGGAACSAG